MNSTNWSSPGAIVGGLTILSSSSTQTTDGTLVMPYLSAVTWAVSTATGYVGAAGLDPGPRVLGVVVEGDREEPQPGVGQLVLQLLPAGQLVPAAAPARPGDQHPLVAGEVVEGDRVAVHVVQVQPRRPAVGDLAVVGLGGRLRARRRPASSSVHQPSSAQARRATGAGPSSGTHVSSRHSPSGLSVQPSAVGEGRLVVDDPSGSGCSRAVDVDEDHRDRIPRN